MKMENKWIEILIFPFVSFLTVATVIGVTLVTKLWLNFPIIIVAILAALAAAYVFVESLRIGLEWLARKGHIKINDGGEMR